MMVSGISHGLDLVDSRIPPSTLRQLRGILVCSLSRENLGALDQPVPAPRRRKVHFEDANAGGAPADGNHKQNSRPSSANRGGLALQLDSSGGQHSPHADQGVRSGVEREREERARLARERQTSERQRKLEELREQALAAQRFREQKEDERRKRIQDMRLRDNDRRTQVEERKRAIWEAERSRREAIVRRNEERDARLENRRRSGCAGAAGVFAFGSSTPRMLEPADTGGTFWGHRRATSTSNVMFAALPLSRRSSERELDSNKKRATSASGLDRQPADDFHMSSSMYEVFHWGGASAEDRETHQRPQTSYYEESAASDMPWSRVARRRTDLVPTIPARGDVTPRHHAQRSTAPGRAYSMSRLDQLAQPRRSAAPLPLSLPAPVPARPPRQKASAHRSMGNLAMAGAGLTPAGVQGPLPPPRKTHRALQSSTGSGLRSGEVTPGSPSRPGSSLSSASTAGAPSAMTSSIAGVSVVNRRPRAAPRRPRPASIAGTGVTTPPHLNNTGVGPDGKALGVRAEKPPLPRVHSATAASKRTTSSNVAAAAAAEKPEVPRRTHKPSSVKASPRITPRATPLQSPATDLPPSSLKEALEATVAETVSNPNQIISCEMVQTEDGTTVTQMVMQDRQTTKIVETESINVDADDKVMTQTTVTETVSDSNGVVKMETVEVVTEVREVMDDAIEGVKTELVEDMKNMKIEETQEETTKQEVASSAPVDLLEGVDMTSSMMARSRGVITTEEEAKAALAERRRLAREEAERQAEKERLRLEREAEEELERQRQEDERQRRLEEETIRLAEQQRKAEQERLQQAILEAERTKEEENQRREVEARAKLEREAAEARAREEAERQRQETAIRLRKEEEDREARRKRVEAIMLRTRQAKQKKDGDKSPTEDGKSIDELDPKDKKEEEDSQGQENTQSLQEKTELESSYEQSVRDREAQLFNHTAPHNQTQKMETDAFNQTQKLDTDVFNQNMPDSQNGSVQQNGTNGDSHQLDLLADNGSGNFSVQNGHSKTQSALIGDMNNFINASDQFNNVAVDNAVVAFRNLLPWSVGAGVSTDHGNRSRKATLQHHQPAVKQNNGISNLLDLSEFDLLNTVNSNNPFHLDVGSNGSGPLTMTLQSNSDQLLELGDSVSKSQLRQDSVNSNQTTTSPFITAFQDNHENRDLSLL